MRLFYKKCMMIMLSAMLICSCFVSLRHINGAQEANHIENVALSAAVTASSNWNDGEGFWRIEFINDGSKMTDWPLPAGQTLGWRSAASNDSRNVNYTIDFELDGVVDVSKVILYPRGNGGNCFPDDYSVLASQDGINYTEVKSVTGDTAVKQEGRTVELGSVQCRYVRIAITKLSGERDGKDNVAELSEIEIFGTKVADAPVNIAPLASVSADSSWNDSEGFWRIEYINDGSKMSDWPLSKGKTLGWRSAASNATRNVNYSILFSFDSLSSISSIRLYPRGNGGNCFPDDYSVQVSKDGVNYTTVKTVTGDTEVKPEGRVISFEPTECQYVRIVITKLSSERDGQDNVAEISEIEIFGTAGESAGFSVVNNKLQLEIGETNQITIKTKNAEQNYSYSSKDPTVASVSSTGLITAKKYGETTIVVKDNNTNKTAECTVNVRSKKIDNILITVPMWGNNNAITEEQFILLRDADIDGVMAVGHDNSVRNQEKMLKIAQNIWDPSRKRNIGVFFHSYLNGITTASSDEEIIAHANQFKGSLAFMGYHIEDEPRDPLPYARVERLLKQTDPYSIADINFLPGSCYETYDNYSKLMIDYAALTGKYSSFLSFDNYPFGPADGSVDESALFGNFEAVRKAGLASGTPTAFYLQGVGSDHFGYRRPDEAVLRYHMAAGMAYGFKWIKYFSWYVPGATGTGENNLFMDAIMDHDDKKTELYDSAKTLHKEIHNVGDILVDLDAVEVYHSGKKSTNSAYQKLPKSFFVQEEKDSYAIISLMVNKDTGKSYLMVVNKDIKASQTISLKLTGVSSLKEIDKSVENGTLSPSFSGGVLTRTFKPGEFALYELPAGDYTSKTSSESNSNILFGQQITEVSNVTLEEGWHTSGLNDGVLFSKSGQMGWKAAGLGNYENTVVFRLDGTKTANRLDIYPAGTGSRSGINFPASVKMYFSDDGSNWKEVFGKSNIGKPTYAVPSYTFKASSGKYVKFVFGGFGTLEIAELALYNDDGSVPAPAVTSYKPESVKAGTNVASGKTALASDSYIDNAWNPMFMTDGHKTESWPTDKTLGWRSGANTTRDKEISVTVDLDGVYPVNKIILYPRGNGGLGYPSDYTVSVSQNGTDWKTVADRKADEGKGEQERTFEFAQTEARYVRISVTKLGPDADIDGYSCQFSEIEVFSAEVKNPEPTSQPTEGPTETPTEAPTEAPTEGPSANPGDPTPEMPTEAATEAPTEAPIGETTAPATDAADEPSPEAPTEAPEATPSAGKTNKGKSGNALKVIIPLVLVLAAAGILTFVFIKRNKKA